MTTDHEGRSAEHGPIFVGVYVHLLVRYGRMDHDLLASSLSDSGVPWTPNARPIFLDAA
jgi:hypothetical protein